MKKTLFLSLLSLAVFFTVPVFADPPPVHDTTGTVLRHRPLQVNENPHGSQQWLDQVFKTRVPGWNADAQTAYTAAFSDKATPIEYLDAFQKMFAALGETGMDLLAAKLAPADGNLQAQQVRNALEACPSGAHQAICVAAFDLAFKAHNMLGIDLWDQIQRNQGRDALEKHALRLELQLRMSDPKLLSVDPAHPGPLALYHLDGLDLVRAFRNWSALREMDPNSTDPRSLRSVPSAARFAIEHFTSMDDPQRQAFVTELGVLGGLTSDDAAIRRSLIAAKVWNREPLERTQLKEEDRAFFDELTKPGGAREKNAARVAKWQAAVTGNNLASLKNDPDFASAPAWLLTHDMGPDALKAFANIDGDAATFMVQPSAFSEGQEPLPGAGDRPIPLVQDGAIIRVPLNDPAQYAAFVRQFAPLLQTGRLSFGTPPAPSPTVHPQTLTYQDGHFTADPGTTAPPAGRQFTAGTTAVAIAPDQQTITLTEQGGQPHTLNVVFRQRTQASAPEKWEYYALDTQAGDGNLKKIETTDGATTTVPGTATVTALNTADARPQGARIHEQGTGAGVRFFLPSHETAGDNTAYLFIGEKTTEPRRPARVLLVHYTGPVSSVDNKKVYHLQMQPSSGGALQDFGTLTVPDQPMLDGTFIPTPSSLPPTT